MGSQQQWQHSTYHLGSSTIQHMGSILLGISDYVKPGYSSDEEDSDVETKKARRLEKAKAAIRDSEESEHSDAASVTSKKSRSRSQSPNSNGSQASRPNSRSPA